MPGDGDDDRDGGSAVSGRFMSINSAVAAIVDGYFTSWFSGLIIGQAANGEMTNFYINGMISIACIYICIYLARFLKAPDGKEAVGEPVFVEQG